MAYYDTIKTPRNFVDNASSRNAVSFSTLQQSNSWESAVSRWGIQHLFACRVICKQPSDVLPLLADKIYSGSETGIHSCIDSLIQGPREDRATLRQMAELQIVRSYELESLGYVWAALAPLLQLDDDAPPTQASARPVRERNPPDRGGYVPSDGIQIGSSRLDRPDSASSAPSSVGYMDGSSAPLVEDSTVRFLNCLIRCVLNYAQPVAKQSPFVQYRDERLAYVYEGPGVRKRFEAIDDGGVQIKHARGNLQVAIVEAKRNFQDVSNGSPTVSNELLAQVVGESLALMLSSELEISERNVVSIVAVKYYIKFFHFNMTQAFARSFLTLPPADENANMATYLRADSTVWFDMREPTGRKYFVRHLVALIAWADLIVPNADGDVEDSESSMDLEE